MKLLKVLALGSILLAAMASGPVAAEDVEVLQLRRTFRHLTLEDGLSQSSVNCILQDRHGFVWLGTQDGLNRYDGHDFKVWKTDADDPLTLSDAYVTCLAEDHDGRLWVGSESSGFARFDRAAWRFDFLCTGPERAAGETGVNYEVLDLIIDPLGRVWVATRQHGLLRHDPHTGEQWVWRHQVAGLPSDEVTALLLDGQGGILVGTAAGLARIDLASTKVETYGLAERVETLLNGDSGEVLIGTTNGLIRYDLQQQRVMASLVPPLLREGGIQCIVRDGKGRLWLGGENSALECYDPETGQWAGFAADLATPTALQSDKIQALLVDQAGVIWVGHDLGASLHDTHSKQFYHFNHIPGDPGSLSDNTVWSLHEDREEMVWVATNNGLNRFDPRSGELVRYPTDARVDRCPGSPAFTVIQEDRQGQLWLGYAHGALDRYDPATGRFHHYAADPAGLTGPPCLRVYSIEEATDGTLWMATWDGIQSYDPTSGRFTLHSAQPGPFDLGGNSCKTLLVENGGVLWVGTWGAGLLRIDPRTGDRRHYRHDPADHRTISSDTIMALLRDQRGRIWIGSGSGISILDPETGECHRFTEKDGLPNNTIYALCADAGGDIWASTNFGLIRLDPTTLAFEHYQAKDGCQSNEFNMNACTFGASGRMYFGGINGFNVFRPDEIEANAYVPPVVLTDFQINNRSVEVGELNRGRLLLDRPIHLADHLELDYRDHVISFAFTALHYAAPKKNRYTYMLEGFDSDWTEASERTHATYTNLPAGHYTFRVRGSNSDGVWNEEGTSISLVVSPPFWRTPWFLTLCAFVGLTAINGIIRYRTRLMKVRTQDLEKRVARRTGDLTRANHFLQQEITERRRVEEALRVAKEEAEQATRAKSEFLANMSHEIRTPMNGVLGMTSVLLEGELSPEHREHLEVVYASARNLLSIINDILDFSKIEAGKLELETIDFDLRSLVEEVGEMLGPRAGHKGLGFLLRVDHDVPANLRGDPGRIRQILVNLVNNAIKFTESGRVEVRVTCGEHAGDAAALRFEVIDSGVGIPTDRMDCLFESFSQVDASTTRKYGGTGLGLAICKQLVDLMGGEIGVQSELGRGTTFWYELTFPKGDTSGSQEPLGLPVLVIMPDPATRQIAVENLRYLGCEVVAPEVPGDPAQAALEALAAGAASRVVLAGTWNQDPQVRSLPTMLQAELGAATPPCLAVFCLGETLDGEELLKAGYAGWVTRPLRHRKLREALLALAAGERTLTELPTAADLTNPDTPPGQSLRSRTGADEAADPDTLPLLLAEDNPVNQKVASILLRKLGYRVEVVDNGAEALDALSRQRFALVFMDVQMPVMDGYEAVRRIRAGEAGVLEPDVAIIALTAHAMKGDRQRCLDAGMDDYLAKPIDQKALVSLLEKYLGAPAAV